MGSIENALKQQSALSAISLKNILFATDFSDRSAVALTYAKPIARKYGSKLYAAHITPEPVGLPGALREGLSAIGIRPVAENKDALAGLDAQLADIPHEILSRKGDVWAGLSEIIEQNRIDLIVAGTHGRTGVGTKLVGSVAEKIFRHASCPVLTVGPAVSGEPSSIVDLHEVLFATDLSAGSLAVLPYAFWLAKENDARLYILHVAQRAPAIDAETLKRRVLDMIPEGMNLTNQPKVLVEYGPPGQRILEIAEEMAMDLIVLSVKRTPVILEAAPHLPLATAYKVVSKAICPVLTIRE